MSIANRQVKRNLLSGPDAEFLLLPAGGALESFVDHGQTVVDGPASVTLRIVEFKQNAGTITIHTEWTDPTTAERLGPARRAWVEIAVDNAASQSLTNWGEIEKGNGARLV